MTHYVYWIHTEGQKDFTTEGYIGISYDPQYRFKQHQGFAIRRLRYPKEMQDAFISEMAKLSVLVSGTVEYCLEVERKLRPTTYFAWNSAIGGDGGVNYKHGLTGTKCKGTFYNLRSKADLKGREFEWQSLESFASFYNEQYKDGWVFGLFDEAGDYSSSNLGCMPRAEYLRVQQRKYNLHGTYHSVSELSDLSGHKPNTISTRLKRGWTVKEATYGR